MQKFVMQLYKSWRIGNRNYSQFVIKMAAEQKLNQLNSIIQILCRLYILQ